MHLKVVISFVIPKPFSKSPASVMIMSGFQHYKYFMLCARNFNKTLAGMIDVQES